MGELGHHVCSRRTHGDSGFLHTPPLPETSKSLSVWASQCSDGQTVTATPRAECGLHSPSVRGPRLADSVGCGHPRRIKPL